MITDLMTKAGMNQRPKHPTNTKSSAVAPILHKIHRISKKISALQKNVVELFKAMVFNAYENKLWFSMQMKTLLRPPTAARAKIEALHTSRNLQISSRTRGRSGFHTTVKMTQNSSEPMVEATTQQY